MSKPNIAVSACAVTSIHEGRAHEPQADLLAVEEPLEIRLGHQAGGRWATRSLSITMRTPGHDFELAAGFLLTEGIVSSARDIASIQEAGKPGSNVVRVDLAPDVAIDFARLERHFYTTSSCGVCGKSSLDALSTQGCQALPRETVRFPAHVIHGLPDVLRHAQSIFDQTGGLHAACLFNRSGEPVLLREDVGRHNAVDKLIGRRLLDGGLPLPEHLLLVSGRASFELVQKALMAGIPILAAVGAPSSLAADLAREFDMTLLGFVRERRFNIYSGDWRIQYETQTPSEFRPASADA